MYIVGVNKNEVDKIKIENLEFFSRRALSLTRSNNHGTHIREYGAIQGHQGC